jgi:hypothetical protein
MKTVAYPRKKIVEVLRTLEEIVVSLDHLGSASYDMTKGESLEALDELISRHRIFRKAAKARAILSSPFSRKLGRDGMDELEREMQHVPYWSPRKKKWGRRTKQWSASLFSLSNGRQFTKSIKVIYCLAALSMLIGAAFITKHALGASEARHALAALKPGDGYRDMAVSALEQHYSFIWEGIGLLIAQSGILVYARKLQRENPTA